MAVFIICEMGIILPPRDYIIYYIYVSIYKNNIS